MNTPQQVSKKIILVGKFGVGKTSLIRRFVHQLFTDEYLVTIGVRVDKKVIQLSNTEVSLIVWDIAGEISMQKISHTYYLGSNGVIYVVDLSRPSTFEQAAEDVDFFRQLLPKSHLISVGNKTDLLSEEELEEVKAKLPINCDFFTSAKIGICVEEIFKQMAEKLI